MKKRNTWKHVIIALASVFVLINLLWGFFVLRCILIRNHIPYNRIQNGHIIHDDAEGYIYGGFDEFHYLSFRAEGYISGYNVDKMGHDCLNISYDFIHGFRFRYVYEAGAYNPYDGLRKGEVYEFFFDKKHNLRQSNSSVSYETFREAAEAMFERARRTWGIK
jgi:hypothetical protein